MRCRVSITRRTCWACEPRWPGVRASGGPTSPSLSQRSLTPAGSAAVGPGGAGRFEGAWLPTYPSHLRHLLLGDSPDLPVRARRVDQQTTTRPSPQGDRDRSEDARQELHADQWATVLDMPQGAEGVADHDPPGFVRGSVGQVVVQVSGEHPPVAVRPPTPLGTHAPLPSAPGGGASERPGVAHDHGIGGVQPVREILVLAVREDVLVPSPDGKRARDPNAAVAPAEGVRADETGARSTPRS